MNSPAKSRITPMPLAFDAYLLGSFQSVRQVVHDALGVPHFTETDCSRTPGGDEDGWAWELPTGQITLITLDMMGNGIIYSNLPELTPVISAFGLDTLEELYQTVPATRLSELRTTTPEYRPCSRPLSTRNASSSKN